MATPEQIRAMRLQEDWEEMKKIISPVIGWIGYGTPPTKYDITYNIRSIIGLDNWGAPIYREIHKVIIDIPRGYPFSGESIVAKMYDGYSPIFHPNFWPGGIICIWGNGSTAWDPKETVAMVCTRIARLIQFDQDLTQASHRANPIAADWYGQQKNSGLFPTDRQAVPLPTSLDNDDFSFTT